MRLLSEAARAAGGVLLTPVVLANLADELQGRALLVGSRSDAHLFAATDGLKRASPDLTLDVAWSGGDAPPGLWGARRRYDAVCLLLTGEGRLREKAAAALAGAPLILAYGAGGRWYRLTLPRFHPASLRSWARLTLAALLCCACACATARLLILDALRRIAPRGRSIPEVGPPSGRRVTFVVPTYNQRHMMDFCLPPLLAEAGDAHEIIVVDDASADDTVAHLRSEYPQVRVVPLRRNRGFAGAVRAGIAASETPLFALINTDVQVRPGFLAAILPHFDRPDTFAVCSRIELPGGSQMETGNVAPAWSGLLEPYHVPPTGPGPILYAGGASSVYDRAKYEALGGFETVYRPLYFEDIELGWRAWRRGWRSAFEPGASVWHQRRAWIGKRFGDAYANETFLRNGLLFTWKNVRDPAMLAQHAAYVCARLLTEVTRGEGTMARAVLRALPHYPRMLWKRWGEWRGGDLPDREILERARPPSASDLLEAGAG